MISASKVVNNLGKLIGALAIAIIAGAFTLFVASATLYSISTDDNTAADWNPVPVFLSDPSGDYNTAAQNASGINDIVQAKVASVDNMAVGQGTDIYFQLKVAGNIVPSATQNQKWIAYIDCDRDGDWNGPNNPFEYDDRMIIHQVFDDSVLSCTGNPPGTGGSQDCFQIPQIPGIHTYSQVPSDDTTTLEWRMPIDSLPPDFKSPNDCRGIIDITFYTAIQYVPTGGSLTYEEYDHIDSRFRYLNAPTAVKITSFEGRSGMSNYQLIWVAVFSLLAGTVIGIVSFVWLGRRRAGKRNGRLPA